MKSPWHETIQKYADGQSSAEEVAVLINALNEDANLRALYLDYMNLDMALGAMADASAFEEKGSNQIISLQKAPAGEPSRLGRWAAAAAAIAALVVFAMLPRAPKHVRTSQDVVAVITSAQNAIARLEFDTSSTLPAWMSPTASLLELPSVPERSYYKRDNESR